MKLIPTIFLLLSITLSLRAQLTLTKLTCEYMDKPTVVDEKDQKDHRGFCTATK